MKTTTTNDPNNSNSVSKDLSEIYELLKSGVITKDEYENLKSELLGQGNPVANKVEELSNLNDHQNSALRAIYEDKIRTEPLNLKLLHEYAWFLNDHQLYKEAVAILLKIQIIDKNDAVAKDLIFRLYIKLGWNKEALDYGEKLLKENPTDTVLLGELVKISTLLSDPAKTTEYYRRILRIQPNHIPALHYNAFNLLGKNQVEEAIEIFQRIFAAGQADLMTTIYAGIGKALGSDFNAAIDILDPVLKGTTENSTELNRGRLYLTYCLCQSSAKLWQIKEKFSSIDFKVLRKAYHQIDEQTVANTIEFILSRSLKDIEGDSNTEIQILIESYLNINYFTKSSNSKIADIWYLIGNKQVEIELYNDALNSYQRAMGLMPDESKYSEKYYEVKKMVEAKRTRTTFLIFAFFITILLAIFAFSYFM